MPSLPSIETCTPWGIAFDVCFVSDWAGVEEADDQIDKKKVERIRNSPMKAKSSLARRLVLRVSQVVAVLFRLPVASGQPAASASKAKCFE